MQIASSIKSAIAGIVLLATTFFSANAQIYITGTFNNWAVLSAVELTKNQDGLYQTVITSGDNLSFKMSTVKGDWDVFDTGTLILPENVQSDTWMPLTYKRASANQNAPAAGSYTILVDMSAMTMKFVPLKTPATAWSGTLPLLHINTENGQAITDKENYISATYYLDNMGVANVQNIGSAQAPLTMQIRGRGNYSWSGFNKKPYRIKLSDKQPLLGMNKSKHWALLAHADDNQGFMRNHAGLTASKLLGLPWTPDCQPCEVVLNGDYIGLYFLTETIRVDKDRVNITEQADNATANVDGGWLVEIDNYDTDPHITIKENGNSSHPIWFTYKSPEALSSQQSAYLQSAMQAIDNAIYATDKTDSAPLQTLVDFDALARFYICQEIMDDCESFHGSCYLSRDRGADSKWHFGPVWDFGNALFRGVSNKFIWQEPAFHQVWIGEIYKFPTFQATVKSVWGSFLSADGADNLASEMTSFANRIALAAICDARRWPDYGNVNETARASAARYIVEQKISWLKEQWGDGAGIENITADSSTISVTTANGNIIIRSATDTIINIATLSGICRNVKVSGGSDTTIGGLAPGFYVVAGQKIILR